MTTHTFGDFEDHRYSHTEYPGVAFWIDRIEDDNNAICIMVGDDEERTLPLDGLKELEPKDYCGECGQIGCAHG